MKLNDPLHFYVIFFPYVHIHIYVWFFAKSPKALLQYDYKSNEERKSNNNKKKERTIKKKWTGREEAKVFHDFFTMEDMINHVCFECLVTCCIDTKSKFNQIKIQL